jgi:hypothetical protein
MMSQTIELLSETAFEALSIGIGKRELRNGRNHWNDLRGQGIAAAQKKLGINGRWTECCISMEGDCILWAGSHF